MHLPGNGNDCSLLVASRNGNDGNKCLPINGNSNHLVEAAVVDIASMLSKLKLIVENWFTGFHSIQYLHRKNQLYALMCVRVEDKEEGRLTYFSVKGFVCLPL